MSSLPPPPPPSPPPAPVPAPGGGGSQPGVVVAVVAIGVVLLMAVVALVVVAVAARDDDDAAIDELTPATTAAPDRGAEPGDSALEAPPTTEDAPAGEPQETVSVFDLEAGDCFDDPEATSGTLSDLPLIACDTPHENEVFAVFDLPGGADAPFPGASAVDTGANDGCQGERFTAYVGVPFAQSRFLVTTITPNRESWEQVDDREVVCVLFDPELQPLEESAEGSAE